jgi:hypothetical protein
MSLYNFKIDVIHCQPDYDNWYEDLPVELSDAEFHALCNAQKKWRTTDEWKNRHCDMDEEYFINKYCPEILLKVRKTLLVKAIDIWDERIIPNLDQADIYVPEEVWDVKEL